jgi:hypothetical protein
VDRGDWHRRPQWVLARKFGPGDGGAAEGRSCVGTFTIHPASRWSNGGPNMTSGAKRSIFVLVIVCCSLLASAVGASSASAVFSLTETKCESGTTITLCWSKKEAGAELFELKGEEAFVALLDEHETAEEHLLLVTLGGEAVHIVCTDTHAEGTAIQTEPLVKVPTVKTPKISFTTCSLLAEGAGLKCELSAESVKEIATTELVGTPKTDEEITFKPASGTVFAEFTIQKKGTATCLAAGTKKVTAPEGVTVLWIEPLSDLEGHLLWIKEPAGLLVAEQAATLLDSLKVHFPTLEESDWWDITEA